MPYPVIGMSPGNSYFKDDVVKSLLEKVIEKYGKTAILIPDIPAISTYIALGYPENRARRDKALPQGNNLRSKVLRAMAELGYTSDIVRVIDWSLEIKDNTFYQEKYLQVLNLYNSNNAFQEEVNNTTRNVLTVSDSEPDISLVKIAAHYLLSEFAFMEFSLQLLKSENVTYIYHKEWPVYEKYIAGEFDGVIREYLGFEIITV
jgi:cyclo(L-tyrosyl-L-tyrosyl) synthase